MGRALLVVPPRRARPAPAPGRGRAAAARDHGRDDHADARARPAGVIEQAVPAAPGRRRPGPTSSPAVPAPPAAAADRDDLKALDRSPRRRRPQRAVPGVATRARGATAARAVARSRGATRAPAAVDQPKLTAGRLGPRRRRGARGRLRRRARRRAPVTGSRWAAGRSGSWASRSPRPGRRSGSPASQSPRHAPYPEPACIAIRCRRRQPASSGSPRRTPRSLAPPDRPVSYVLNLKLADPATAPAFAARAQPAQPPPGASGPTRHRRAAAWQDIREASANLVRNQRRALLTGRLAARRCSPWPASRCSSAAGWPTRSGASGCSRRSAARRAWSPPCCSPSTSSSPCVAAAAGLALGCADRPAAHRGQRRPARQRGRAVARRCPRSALVTAVALAVAVAATARARRPRGPHQHRPRACRRGPPAAAHGRLIAISARLPVPLLLGLRRRRPPAAPRRPRHGQHRDHGQRDRRRAGRPRRPRRQSAAPRSTDSRRPAEPGAAALITITLRRPRGRQRDLHHLGDRARRQARIGARARARRDPAAGQRRALGGAGPARARRRHPRHPRRHRAVRRRRPRRDDAPAALAAARRRARHRPRSSPA